MQLNPDGKQWTSLTKVPQRRISEGNCKGDFPAGWRLGENTVQHLPNNLISYCSPLSSLHETLPRLSL